MGRLQSQVLLLLTILCVRSLAGEFSPNTTEQSSVHGPLSLNSNVLVPLFNLSALSNLDVPPREASSDNTKLDERENWPPPAVPLYEWLVFGVSGRNSFPFRLTLF